MMLSKTDSALHAGPADGQHDFASRLQSKGLDSKIWFDHRPVAVIAWTLAFFIFAQDSCAQDDITKDVTVGTSVAPSWAEEQTLPVFPDHRFDAVQDGIAYLLSNQQIRWSPGGYDYFAQHAYEVINRTGLEPAARISESFDPELATMNFNFIRVYRANGVIDKLDQTAITLLRQETGLSAGIMDGELTAVINLEDVKVGDIVEYAYSGRINTPLWPLDYFTGLYTEWSAPLARYDFRLLWPKGKPLYVRQVNTDMNFTTTDEGEWSIYSLTQIDPEPKASEYYIPDDYEEYGYLSLSSMEEWSDISRWASGVFDIGDALPRSFRTKVRRIAKKWSAPEDRAVEALRLVQSEIRYLGLEMGLGSHKPREPKQTIISGYGDCKDKSVLLVAMLNDLGIKAKPVLVHTYAGQSLPQRTPSIGAFNHAIVRATINGQSYWLDPTLIQQGGRLKDLSPLDYGYALPIESDGGHLIPINTPLPETPLVSSEETYSFPENGEVGMTLFIETVHRGGEADDMRWSIADSGLKNMEREYLNYYTKTFDDIELNEPMSVKDNFEDNEVTITESYVISRQAFIENGMDTKLYIRANTVQDTIPDELEANRQAPLAMPYGSYREHIINLHTPGRQFSSGESTRLEGPGILYTGDFMRQNDVYQATYRLRIDKRSVGVDEAPEVIALAEKIDDESTLTVDISRAVPTYARRLGLEGSLDADVESQLDEVMALINNKKNVNALEVLNDLLSSQEQADTLRGFVQVLRGAVLLELKRGRAARPALKEAFELYTPDTPDLYFHYIGLLQDEDDDPETARILIRLLKDHPDASTQVNVRWLGGIIRRLSQDDHRVLGEDMTVALAHALHAVEQETETKKDSTDAQSSEWVFSNAIEILSERGEAETGRPFVSHISNPRLISPLIMNKASEPLWQALEQKAGTDLSLSIEQYVQTVRVQAENDPDDLEKQHRYIGALRQAGKQEQAILLSAPLMENWSRIEAVGRHAYWLVNEHAYSLMDVGRSEEAAQLMKKLISIGIRENGELINMGINRASMLLDAGRFDQALEPVEQLEEIQEDGNEVASDYGWMFIYGVKACALHQLGQQLRAKDVLDVEASEVASSNQSAHMATLICLDRVDEAERILMQRLSDPNERSTAIASFIEVTLGDGAPVFLKNLIDKAKEIRSRKSVQDAFAKHARPLHVATSSTAWANF